LDTETRAQPSLTPECVAVLPTRIGESSLASDRLIPPSPRQTMLDTRQTKGFHEHALEAGRHALLIAVPGYAATVHEFEVHAGQLLTDVRIDLHRGATIRGRLLDAKGQPVAKRRVVAIGHGALADAQLDKWRTHKQSGRA